MCRLHICASFSFLLLALSGTQGLNSALLGEICDVDKECLTRQMTCKGTCVCLDGHYGSEDRRNCIATSGSSCYETMDCYGLTNSECHELEKICVCTTSYQPSEDGKECLSDSQYQGDCKSSIQCTTVLGDSGVCENEKCGCKSQSHYSTTELKCIPSKFLNDACVNATQCMTKDLKEDLATCTEGKCVCRQGMSEFDGSCRDSGANHLMISGISILAYWIIKLVI